jgi:membrane protease YdiL (CAAX protease family)
MSEPGDFRAAPTHSASARSWRRLFAGTPGLGGAIGLLAFCAMAFLAFPAQGRVIGRSLHGMDATLLYVLDHLVQLAELLLFAWGASRLEQRSFAAYGLPWREAFRSRFWQGAALGMLSISGLVFAVAALGGVKLALPAHLGPEALLFAAGYLALFMILGFREEFLYRGYGLATLGAQIGFWPAAVVSSVWFVSTHSGNSGENVLGLAAVGLFGLFACQLLRRTGNLWLPIGFHAVWDWSETYLFGVSDSGHAAAPGHFFTATVQKSAPGWISGGAAGPEGSVLCMALIAILAVVRMKRPPRREAATRG